MIPSNLISPYLAWLVIFVLVPTAILWVFNYKTLWRYRLIFAYLVFFSIVFGVAWDVFAIKNEIWYWPEECCSLPRVAGLPLEEFLFMIFVSIQVGTVTLVARKIYLTHKLHKKWN